MVFSARGPRCCLLATLAAATAAAQSGPDRLRIEREIVVRGGTSQALAWSPDGRWIASGGICGDVIVVDAETGRVVHELPASDHGIGSLLFAPDSRILFAGGRELTRWDLGSAQRSAQVVHASPRGVALSRDGATIACVAHNNVVELRAAADLQLQRSFTVPDDTAIDAVAFDRAAARLAVGKRSGNTYLFAIDSGEIVASLTQPDPVQSLAYRGDNTLVRLGSEGKLLGFTKRDEALDKSAWGMAIDPAARLCVTWDGEHVRGFTRDGAAFTVPGGGPAAVHCDGTTWVRARGNALELHRGADRVRTLPLAHRVQPAIAVLVGDGQHIACSGADCTHVFDLATGAAVPFPGAALRGMPLVYRGGTELAMWQGADLFDEPTGRLSFWSVAAQRAGRPSLVREHNIACAPSGLEPYARLQFSSDGRYFDVGNTVRDAMQPDAILWRGPEDDFWLTLHPLPGGRAAWGWSQPRACWGDGGATLQLRLADGTSGPKRECGCCYAMDLSADGSQALLSRHDGVFVLDTETGATTRLADAPRVDARWLGSAVLLLGTGGQLELVSAATGAVVATLAVPCRHGQIAVAADGKRAAVVLHDRVLTVHVGRE
ncbi:MAG TPA: hypothetical protein VF384_11925 [Planctomycetota bacterium]